MRRRYFFAVVLACFVFCFSAFAQGPAIPADVHVRILKAEDERRYDDSLAALLRHSSAAIRARAALAAGRIGDARAVTALLPLLQNDPDAAIRARAAFALGEIESDAASAALLEILRGPAGVTDCAESCWLLRARAVEALGKIAAALPASEAGRKSELGAVILSTLSGVRPGTDATEPARGTILFGLTAALRVRPTGGAEVVALFLGSADARIRADAGNALARLNAKNAPAVNETLRSLLAKDSDPIVRANAARTLGASQDSASADALCSAATADADLRVRVSAIRALAQVKATSSAPMLLARAKALFSGYVAAKGKGIGRPVEINEILEIATALGQLLTATNDEPAVKFLNELRLAEGYVAPELEIAAARVAPSAYINSPPPFIHPDTGNLFDRVKDWRFVASYAQGVQQLSRIEVTGKELAQTSVTTAAEKLLKALWSQCDRTQASSTLLRAYISFKPSDSDEVLRSAIHSVQPNLTATAVTLLAQLPRDPITEKKLIQSLEIELAITARVNARYEDYFILHEMWIPDADAVLALLNALAAQKTPEAYEAIKTALKSPDHLVRRRAVALLKEAGQGDFSAQIGFVTTRYKDADYQRALARMGKKPRAVVTTDKGAFTIELLPDDAPITVDNFILLAEKKYFDGIVIHRVVPNFVIQDGDPRGDGEGGPGWQIRCEINEAPYDRGAVGMALSGKDTGGSQWFVTHSPQPHLDGGYTVFGRVIAGMDVVDRIVRLDRIVTIRIVP